MSKHETPLTKKYWESVGGTLVLEFPAVSRSTTAHGKRFLDGVIVVGGETKIARARDVEINGNDIIVIQTKARRVGMYLLGQAIVSAELMRAYRPKSARSVAICTKGDDVLEPIALKFGVEVIVFGDQ